MFHSLSGCPMAVQVKFTNNNIGLESPIMKHSAQSGKLINVVNVVTIVVCYCNIVVQVSDALN